MEIMESSMKRKREEQAYSPVKRVYVYRSPDSLIPANLTPNSHRDSVRGLTSIMVAAQMGALAAVRFHVEARGPHLALQRYGPHSRTLLHLAARAGSLELVTYLCAGLRMDVLATDDSGATALDMAKTEEVRVFLQREMLWERRKTMVFCFSVRVELLSRLPEELFRAIFAEGIF